MNEDKMLGVGTTQADCEGLENSETPMRDIIANPKTHNMIANDVNVLRDLFHGASREAGWWDKTDIQKRAEVALEDEGALGLETVSLLEEVIEKERCPYTQQVLIISEVIEAMEGVRKNLMDDKLPHHKMEDIEMADVFIRLMDYCGGRGINLGKVVVEKAAFNINRTDHTKEAREGVNGKRV